MSIPDGYKRNFQTLMDAIEQGDVCLMECSDAKTSEPVFTICAINRHPSGEYEMVPMARMFDGNPYEQLSPPSL